MLLRATVAFVALPGIIAFAVPLVMGRWAPGEFQWIALVPLAIGIALLLWCIREFYVIGRGTLAPWDPPRHLVTSGPYRFSRNPMNVAVGIILLGWAVGFASWRHLLYAAIVLTVFHVRVAYFEEPIHARVYRDEWTRYAARVPRWVFRSRGQVLAAWVAAIVLAAIAGLFYEAYADGMAAQEFPPPGTLVDIGGGRLHLLCIGEGNPTVFFEASEWGISVSSARARERIAGRTTVCSYDRRGLGWSDPGPAVASVGDLAREFAVLQDRAGLRGPYVIVASSAGALTAELFAREYPERAAGLVFVGADSIETLRQRRADAWRSTLRACAASTLSYFGVVRIADPFRLAAEDSVDARRAAALTYNSRPWAQHCAIARGLPESVRQFETANALRSDLPIVALPAETTEDDLADAVVELLEKIR